MSKTVKVIIMEEQWRELSARFFDDEHRTSSVKIEIHEDQIERVEEEGMTEDEFKLAIGNVSAVRHGLYGVGPIGGPVREGPKRKRFKLVGFKPGPNNYGKDSGIILDDIIELEEVE